MDAISKHWTRRRFLLALGGTAGTFASIGAYRVIESAQAQTTAATSPVPIPSGGLQDLRNAAPFDVCIIGSGPAGASLGLDLAQKGVRTLIIESGVDFFVSGEDARLEQLQTYKTTGAIDYPVRTSRVRALGGTSNIWTGRCPRLHPLDFESNAYTPGNNPWPISYADIEPYYAQAERTLRVHGGQLSGYHAPRAEPLPPPMMPELTGLKEMMRKAGITVDNSPSSVAIDGSGPVRMANSLLPAFAAHPNAAIVSGVTVTRLLTNRDGHVIGAEIKDLDRNSTIAQAKVYVVAAGGIESARLLLLSRSETFPNGIGNHYDRVGRCFMEHPNIRFNATIPRTWNLLSPRYQFARCHQFYDEFKREGFGSPLFVFTPGFAKGFPDQFTKARFRIGASIEMSPEDSNRVKLAEDVHDYFGDPVPELSLSFSERDQQTLERVRRSIRSMYSTLKADDVNELTITWSHHHIGTCRMGHNPKTSVISADLRVHGTDNLYIAGSAGFVTSGASHPTLLITALSHRLAEHLRESLNSGAYDRSGSVSS